jgi:hypothetical protein
MENRNRDEMRKDQSTKSGEVSRDKSLRKGQSHDDSSASFDKKIDRPENLKEPNRRTGRSSEPGLNSSSGRSSSGVSSPRRSSSDDESSIDSGRMSDKSKNWSGEGDSHDDLG